MQLELGKTIYLDFIISDHATGAAVDDDATPTCHVFEDDNDTPIYTPDVVKRTSLVGNYRVRMNLTAANGFEKNRSYNAVVYTSVSGVSGKRVLTSFIIDDTMDKLTNASLLVTLPVDPLFVPTIDDFVIPQPPSMLTTFGGSSLHPYKEIFEGYFDQTLGQWKPDFEALVPADFNTFAGDPVAAFLGIKSYNDAKAAYDAEYSLQKEIQWKEYVAQKVIDNTES